MEYNYANLPFDNWIFCTNILRETAKIQLLSQMLFILTLTSSSTKLQSVRKWWHWEMEILYKFRGDRKTQQYRITLFKTHLWLYDMNYRHVVYLNKTLTSSLITMNPPYECTILEWLIMINQLSADKTVECSGQLVKLKIL